MSTTWRENYFFKRIFKARRERTKRRKSAALFRPLNPSSGQTDFRVTDRRGASADIKTELPYLLGSIDPCPTAICTRGRSTWGHPQGFVTSLHACLLAGA
ncbi:hypothetical protein COCC4DRAFT_155483 [Bipolaris maydis ATCC 48331]|uniref:Uncharacterized protein n=1 Tax=Cochliobolus heterostrophus (strain C4 / ATCC 48331 / race T) TaxID=665024 RepID=N4WR03_COCH4|nr:hypothetical protein COCC4DRAFT_155483 [Bipolaris maydis ATCC 48331]